MPEFLRVVRLRGSVLDLPPTDNRARFVSWCPRLSLPMRMVRRVSVMNAHVAVLDVVVERLQTRDIPVWERLDDGLPSVVWRATKFEHEMLEEDRHSDRDLHLRPHVRLAFANGLSGLLKVVFRVDPPVAAADRLADRAAAVFAPPGLVGDAVDLGE